jgi:hypothetical protein
VAVIPLGAKSPPPSCSLPAASLSEWAFSSPLIWPCSGGVYRAASVAGKRGGLLPHHFTLTTMFRGGLFSVALSVTAKPPCPGVTWRLAHGARTFLKTIAEAITLRLPGCSLLQI